MPRSVLTRLDSGSVVWHLPQRGRRRIEYSGTRLSAPHSGLTQRISCVATASSTRPISPDHRKIEMPTPVTINQIEFDADEEKAMRQGAQRARETAAARLQGRVGSSVS